MTNDQRIQLAELSAASDELVSHAKCLEKIMTMVVDLKLHIESELAASGYVLETYREAAKKVRKGK